MDSLKHPVCCSSQENLFLFLLLSMDYGGVRRSAPKDGMRWRGLSVLCVA